APISTCCGRPRRLTTSHSVISSATPPPIGAAAAGAGAPARSPATVPAPLLGSAGAAAFVGSGQLPSGPTKSSAVAARSVVPVALFCAMPEGRSNRSNFFENHSLDEPDENISLLPQPASIRAAVATISTRRLVTLK